MNLHGMVLRAWIAALLLACAAQAPAEAPAQKPPVEPAARPAASQEDPLQAAFASQGIHLDLARKLCSVPAEVLVRGDLLEYLVVGPGGATHESAFLVNFPPSRLNAALLALGAQEGTNARWRRREPQPSLEEQQRGVPAWDVEPPAGDGFYLYVAWKLAGDVHFHRMEDLILDLSAGQTLRRHRWVYLGSRLLRSREGPGEVFAADLEGNVVNISFFDSGNTLLTAALPECESQVNWQANWWVLPDSGSPVEIVFARERLDSAPAEVVARLTEARRAGTDDGK